MQAIILAGGFGTRLKEVVSDLPKPMAPIGDKPFLALLMDYLRRNGVRDVVLSVHYQKEKIEEYFRSNFKGMNVKYAVEEVPLGTGGAITNSFNVLKPRQPVIVINGDTFLRINLREMFSNHVNSGSDMTIALRRVEDSSRYGAVVVEDNVIKDFMHAGGRGAGYINAGIYIINPQLFEKYKLNHAFSFERDFLYQYTPQIKPNAYLTEDYFIDIGVPDDYKKACTELPGIIGGQDASEE